MGAMTQTAAATSPFKLKSYGDIVLALGVMAIMALMVLRLPTAVIDVLVAVNIACGVVLLLIALYVKHPVAFNSFPSVLLISTLFRLSLSVATTRLILLDGDAGHIIDAFGNFVAGGNLVVGVVVFIIITIVQFIVIAKGAERVAEVAARFTLDAMPGKQLSIDSDLRSGLIDKDEARRRRTLLEQESQLNGALDGAMKFVKGDAIASIVIVIVNLLGGLTIGVLQRGLPAGEAMQLYSILTIGEGMVAQIPALLSAMAAGLVVTRSASDGNDSHLGDTIGRQISAHPRALMMTSVISALLALVPGFPTLVFLGLAVVAFVLARRAMAKAGKDDDHSTGGSGTATALHHASRRTQDEQASIAQPLVVEIGASAKSIDLATLRRDLADAATKTAAALGIRLPQPALIVSHDAAAPGWRICIFDVPVASSAPSEAFKADAVLQALEKVLTHQAERFVGVQEVSDLLDAAAEQYPALVKEVLRQISAQKVAEVLRLLLRESIPLRNLRDVLEALAEWGSKERDAAGLAEFVRIGLKRYMTSRYADANRHIAALVIDASVEDAIRRALTDTPAGVLLMLPPKRVAELRDGLSHQLARLGNTTHPVLVTNVDVRRHVRQALEAICPTITVLSYQELAPDVEVQPLGTVRFHSEERNAA
jgi:type III secretion protein V